MPEASSRALAGDRAMRIVLVDAGVQRGVDVDRQRAAADRFDRVLIGLFEHRHVLGDEQELGRDEFVVQHLLELGVRAVCRLAGQSAVVDGVELLALAPLRVDDQTLADDLGVRAPGRWDDSWWSDAPLGGRRESLPRT